MKNMRCLLPRLRVGLVLGAVCLLAQLVAAQDPTVAPLMKLLQSGRLPKERQPQVVEMICKRGGADELKVVLDQVLKPEAMSPQLRVQTLGWLTTAAETRKVKPAGDLQGIEALLKTSEGPKAAELALAAMQAASVWRVEAAADELMTLAQDETANLKLRAAAIRGLATLATDESKQVLAKLATGNFSTSVRLLATASLASVDRDAAAKAAAEVLLVASPDDETDPMLNEFFLLKDGPATLASALKGKELQPDVAKRALRFMYSVGQNDPALSDLLSQMAGIAADAPPPTPEESLKIAAEVAAKGDAVRGEQVFRRADVSCLKCHAIHRAGGQVGPDLSNVGRISPVDYIVNSVLNPNLAIKEAFVTRIIETSEGKLVQGVAVDRDDNRVVLRTADGKTAVIATADIESEEEGRSLMPQGLTKFLTQQEFYDLAKFVSELGKEGGAYNAPKTPAIQRWRVLAEPHPDLLSGVPNVEQVREYVLDAPADAWRPAYAMVSGQLPIAELRPAKPSSEGSSVGDNEAAPPIYLMGEVDVVEAGEVELSIEMPGKLQLWIDANPVEISGESATKVVPSRLTAGRHKITLRLEPNAADEYLRVSIAKPNGSTAQFDIVAGQ